MKYVGLPSLMWVVYKNSFKKNLVTTLSFTEIEAKKSLDYQRINIKK